MDGSYQMPQFTTKDPTLNSITDPEMERTQRPGRLLRVLHIVPSFYPAHYYGGPIETVLTLCRYLAQANCEVRVLTTDANGPDETLDVGKGREIHLQDGVHVRYCRRVGAVSISPELLACLPGYVHWADIVHLTAIYSFPTIPALLTARMRNKGVVWSPCGALDPWPGQPRKRLKHLWRNVCSMLRPSAVVIHAASAQEKQHSELRFPRIPSVVIPNGVDVPDIVNRTSVGPESFRLLYLGRLHPQKGLDNLLEACILLGAGGKGCRARNWSLTITGPGERQYIDHLKAVVQNAGLSERVRVLGPVAGSARENTFSNADVLICPSHGENFGMVIVEALAREIPVIASNRTPWSDLADRGCGLWVDNSPSNLADAIVRISAMPLEVMGRRGRAWMTQEFGWKSQADRMRDLYCRLREARNE
jgi:glycosyltransferase involved in cell wall biosynthesis